jgi:hypothetical protein
MSVFTGIGQALMSRPALFPVSYFNLEIFKTKKIQSYPYTFFYQAGLDINACPIPVKTDIGQVDLVSR